MVACKLTLLGGSLWSRAAAEDSTLPARQTPARLSGAVGGRARLATALPACYGAVARKRRRAIA